MKNLTRLLVITWILCSFQPSFAAFPVKHNPVLSSSVTKPIEPATAEAANSTHKSSWLATHITNALRPFSNLLNPERRRNDTCGTLSLVFGILGILGAFPFAIAAIILGAIGKKHHEEYARAGFTLGIVGLALVAFIAIIVLFAFGF